MAWQHAKNKELLDRIRSNNAYWKNITWQSQLQHNQRMAPIESRRNTSRSMNIPKLIS
jgi:hypothetical protein